MDDTKIDVDPDTTQPPEIVPVDNPLAPVDISEMDPEADREASPSGFQDDLSRNDAKMVARALKLGWNIPDKYKQPLLNRLLFIALNDDPEKGKVSSHRERLSAIRTLLIAEGQAIDLMGVILNRKQDQVNVQVNVQQPEILKRASVEQLEGLQKLVLQIEAEKPTVEQQKRKSEGVRDRYKPRPPPEKNNEV
jgi:hypothetical protein